MIKLLQYDFPRLEKIIADREYRGNLTDVVKGYGCDLSVILRHKESSKKFQVLPLRWIVERTFSWIGNYRRMTTDYDYKTESVEAVLQVTFSQIMLKTHSINELKTAPYYHRGRSSAEPLTFLENYTGAL